MLKVILFTLVTIAVPALCLLHLEQYNVDPNEVTVSGISAGGAMATQFHVIHSSEVKGAAMFAGIVYHCANGLLATALTCMSAPGLTNVDSMISKTENQASSGTIDATANLLGSPVYVFHSPIDSVVLPGSGTNIEEYYQHFGANILSEHSVNAAHSQPTDFYGPACDYLGGEYINNCNYHGAYMALNHLYDNTLIRPNGSEALNGIFDLFDQTDYFYISDPALSSMDDMGYVYIPSGCVDKTNVCKLHIALHGCLMGRYLLDDVFARNTGYLQVAEVNNIIVLFPQAIKLLLTNPNGCFDWWGYTNYLYITKSGNQILALHRMMERILYGI
ncbi:hypothetical protein SK128_015272 [Halocaridina rubra]|uniref:Uncharacterized protein n=1 Tax=Halocaridina rubra TaxID=373956 RepID=A0AAN9A5I2_HALRR